MSFADAYIEKNKGPFFFEPKIFVPCQLFVVIPCYDEPDVTKTLLSLFECEDPGILVSVLVVINCSETSIQTIKNQNGISFNEIIVLKQSSPIWLDLNVLNVGELPFKNAGVGWARKIGMDWAIVNFNKFDEKDGIIVSLDADSLVDRNYLKAICDFHKRNPDYVASTIYFEHLFDNSETAHAAILYELYMRYFKNALKSTSFPGAMYTVGSCFSVIAEAYVAQGGMNRRKAGEDFYFLNKILMFGKICENNNTVVFPSSRFSDRVPFGTGQVLSNFISEAKKVYYTYSHDSFLPLIDIFSNLDLIYQRRSFDEFIRDKVLLNFCIKNSIQDRINSLISNCSTKDVFLKRFYHLFDNFTIIKWLNYATENSFPKSDLLNESIKLFQFIGVDIKHDENDPLNILSIFRERDKNNLL